METQPNPELIVRSLYLKDSCYDNRKTLIYIFDTWDVRSRSLKHEKVHLQESVNQGVIPSHLAVLVERGRNTRALTSSVTAISKHSAELSRQGLSNFTSVAVVMGYGSLHGVDRVPHVYDLSSSCGWADVAQEEQVVFRLALPKLFVWHWIHTILNLFIRYLMKKKKIGIYQLFYLWELQVVFFYFK